MLVFNCRSDKTLQRSEGIQDSWILLTVERNSRQFNSIVHFYDCSWKSQTALQKDLDTYLTLLTLFRHQGSEFCWTKEKCFMFEVAVSHWKMLSYICCLVSLWSHLAFRCIFSLKAHEDTVSVLFDFKSDSEWNRNGHAFQMSVQVKVNRMTHFHSFSCEVFRGNKSHCLRKQGDIHTSTFVTHRNKTLLLNSWNSLWNKSVPYLQIYSVSCMLFW